ncbi:hypothetical protein DFQ14_101581 [Halopolyspora algeriensis]|uniref:Uncharacterized protein n=1 Tax=Halopolyspora algeriensis TaxID=1500506 RepID=A0A368VZA7_9ACTN|nr:hypothetical protein DFQ14_101581 [Halopolyspora algeriensis]TQM48320.1 hypothetical protein FHU43_3287 [Halopolyspora algeriensis]
MDHADRLWTTSLVDRLIPSFCRSVPSPSPGRGRVIPSACGGHLVHRSGCGQLCGQLVGNWPSPCGQVRDLCVQLVIDFRSVAAQAWGRICLWTTRVTNGLSAVDDAVIHNRVRIAPYRDTPYPKALTARCGPFCRGSCGLVQRPLCPSPAAGHGGYRCVRKQTERSASRRRRGRIPAMMHGRRHVKARKDQCRSQRSPERGVRELRVAQKRVACCLMRAVSS